MYLSSPVPFTEVTNDIPSFDRTNTGLSKDRMSATIATKRGPKRWIRDTDISSAFSASLGELRTLDTRKTDEYEASGLCLSRTSGWVGSSRMTRRDKLPYADTRVTRFVWSGLNIGSKLTPRAVVAIRRRRLGYVVDNSGRRQSIDGTNTAESDTVLGGTSNSVETIDHKSTRSCHSGRNDIGGRRDCAAC
ncbi:hypothetical protein CYLTODRAFT_74896 [Cylindrobasidium torrendii FP15055 ss-10]|uniref:Uncharacterized protein n=1 Tax=Cylindrobasidium torrendii FP15055 ss-10 TaxID=1314674 RepID=A0A0D7B3C9_9AGAR|nr:hypothetical protein CYLTODRAFT_74896 [Cylindrobasidium torrendii FP15055 ss-10]